MPVTAQPARRGGPPKYPWIGMNVGDSFLVPADKVPAGGWFALYACGRQWAHGRPERRGAKFFALDVPGGVRVWCIARPASVTVEPVPASVPYTVEACIPVPRLTEAEWEARSWRGGARAYPQVSPFVERTA